MCYCDQSTAGPERYVSAIQWLYFMVWEMSSLGLLRTWGCWSWVCVIFLPKYLLGDSLPHPLSYHIKSPASSHLLRTFCSFVAPQKHKNTYVDMLMNTLLSYLSGPLHDIVSDRDIMNWGEKELRNQTGGDDVSRACAASWVLNRESQSRCPCCGWGCLLGRHNCRVERDPPVQHKPELSQDWTTLMFFLASPSDKGVCALVDRETRSERK